LTASRCVKWWPAPEVRRRGSTRPLAAAGGSSLDAHLPLETAAVGEDQRPVANARTPAPARGTRQPGGPAVLLLPSKPSGPLDSWQELTQVERPRTAPARHHERDVAGRSDRQQAAQRRRYGSIRGVPRQVRALGGRTSRTTTKTDTSCLLAQSRQVAGAANEKPRLDAHRASRPTRRRSPKKAPVPDRPNL
jgi:hypothetical protein